MRQEPIRDIHIDESLHDNLSDEEPRGNSFDETPNSESFDEELVGEQLVDDPNSESSDNDQNIEPSIEEPNGELFGDEPNSETSDEDAPRREPLEDGAFGGEEPIDIPDGINANAESDPLQVKIENTQIFNQVIAEDVINSSIKGFNAVKIDEDLEMFFDSDDSFKPMIQTHQVKPNDAFSGNVPFSIDVNNDRLYNWNGINVRIPAKHVTALSKSNATTNIEMFDKTFVRVLLLIIFGPNAISTCRQEPELIEFIKGTYFFLFSSNILVVIVFSASSTDLFQVRVGNTCRLGLFGNIVDEFISEKSDTNN